MKAMILSTSLLFSALFSFSAVAAPDMPLLKKAVIDEFLKQANNPKTKLAKRIDQINVDTTDGRNSDGSITIPVKEEELQVSFLSAEELYNPWHYASKSDDEKTCLAGGDSATFLILLSGYTGVHGASEYETYAFTASVNTSQTAVRKDGGVIEYCEDVMADPNDEFKVSDIEYSVTEFKELEIKLPEESIK